ncbi:MULTISPECIES: pseudouridine synthase [Faecalicoccus]|uniref:Pseudouridine synthase n=1 Tax=Faecalicoccus pleomorphus TaxID=1323 RepID=A0AAW6CY74_9FIRM|nr:MULTISPECIES: pseudouridine synthase [Faecalicoccus]MDB7980748.1 pseudouridine synthase [Faecalicoccus pleomorphus]MDB7982955.1 pseudouridine synthase [Faecalicoccus pleomorphus]MDY4869538.1 pseudouridine synthase [Faecalicoccus sp.]
MAVRLDKFLSHMGYGTRNEVKNIIKNGWVTIDGETIKKADFQVKEDQTVYVDDVPVSYVRYEYYILNKPAGYVSATEDNLYPTVMELIPSIRNDLYPVGRLDLDTEGLLLVCNDGQLTHELLSPKKHVLKKYYVEFEGSLPENAIDIFAQPMDLDDFVTKPAQLEVLDQDKAYLTISEGKFHQVKRMFQKVGCEVTYLQRVCFGPLELKDLEIGRARALTPEEIELLKTHND